MEISEFSICAEVAEVSKWVSRLLRLSSHGFQTKKARTFLTLLSLNGTSLVSELRGLVENYPGTSSISFSHLTEHGNHARARNWIQPTRKINCLIKLGIFHFSNARSASRDVRYSSVSSLSLPRTSFFVNIHITTYNYIKKPNAHILVRSLSRHGNFS